MLRSKVATTEGIVDSGVVLRRGDDFGDHDHPNPRRLKKRSNASRLTLEMEKCLSRALGSSSWSIVDMYLLIGSLIKNAHSNDLSTIANTASYVNNLVEMLMLISY